MSFPKTTGKTRKKYTSQFKFNLAKEAVKTGNLSEISKKYGVGVNIISTRVKHLEEQGFHIFETTPDQQNNQLKSKIAKLEQMAGKSDTLGKQLAYKRPLLVYYANSF